MKRVIFVGMHNKPDILPLCQTTKSGKLIHRVVKELECKSVLSNLYDVEQFPGPFEKYALALDWHHRIDPAASDIIVLLGAEVHKNFISLSGYFSHILKYPHPSSRRSHKQMDEFVEKMVNEINATPVQ